jgi:hypothetical protein
MRPFLKIHFLGLLAIFLGFFAFPAAASTYYVDINSPNPTPPYTNWNTASTDIQSAVNQTTNGDLVLVNPGVYQSGGETVNGYALTNRLVIDEPITVQSVNGPGVTFIDGYQVPGTTCGINAIRCVYMTGNSALIGFTLTGGATRNSGSNANDENGGGIWCAATNSVIISNCVIMANAAWNEAGGVYQGTLLNCTILNNFTVVSSGYGYGGGVANALIYNSMVISNTAWLYGGGVYNGTVFNSTIALNYSAYEGGGAYEASLVNCTVTANTAEFGGGTSGCNQTNCIVYFNSVIPIDGTYSSASNYDGGSFNYCCSTPSDQFYGTGDITSDPQLASISHISANSPCRGAGNPAVTSGVDIDGNPWANPPSIGCSELYPGNDFGNLIVGISVPFTNWAPGYPLNFQANITGPVYNSVWNFGDGTLATNQPYISHAWATNGNYPVTLTAYNDSYPTGVTATLLINIAVPSTYYVNLYNQNPSPPYSYWSTAATNIQDAISVAPAGSLILVTNGAPPYVTNGLAVYQSSGSPAPKAPNGYNYTYNVVITNPVTVESVNGPSKTYIAGPSSGGGCVYAVNGAILSGFTITNGTSYYGGGVSAASTNAVITNCIITHCNIESFIGFGGAAYLGTLYNCAIVANLSSFGDGGATALSTLNNCIISNNSAGDGGGVCGGILNNCLIVSNTATDGGGVFAEAGFPALLNNCIISNNTAQYGGGVLNTILSTNCVLNNCTLTRNSANAAHGSGGGAYDAELNNCLISSNKASGGGVGGGAYNSSLVNCTVTANTAGNGGGVYDCTADNSILYYNTGGDYDPTTFQYFCCTAVLPTSGLRNITNAPLFVNAAGGNFQLQPNSPCINSGNNAYITMPTDLAGNPRIVVGTVDIGAYEYQSPTSVISYAWLQQYGLPTDGSVDYTNLDGTAFNVYQDWIAGLNPTNSASVLAMLTPVATNNANGITVTWQSVSGISYNLLRSTNLPAFTTLQPNIAGQTNTTSYTDTSATNNFPYFYRVGVLAP